MVNNVLDYLDDSVRKYPQKTAVADDKGSYTYEQLKELSVHAAAALLKYVENGQPVAVYMEKRCAVLPVFLGIAMTGCFYVMLDASQPAERIRMILDTLGTNVLVAGSNKRGSLDKLNFQGNILPCESILEHLPTEQELERLAQIRSQAIDIDPLYAIFTSGSTGVPKGVIVSHRSVIDFIENFTLNFNITHEDVIGNQAPFDFDVSVKDIYSSLKCGARLQIIPKSMFSFPMKLLDYLDEYHVTTLIWAVSALCIITTLNGFDYKIPASVNKVIFSGEVMPVKHLNKWRKVYPEAMFVNVYGPTEITCNCTYYIVNREFGNDEILPMGKPFKNERVFLLDEQNKQIFPKDMKRVGEICVSGTAVTLGYYNNREKTDAAFVQNPLNDKYNEIIYRTGDLGFYNEQGELCFASRKDFQIKHNGHRIELGEIDTAMNAMDEISRACCVYNQDENKIIAFYEGEADNKSITHALMQKIPKFMIPEEFRKVDRMPVTKNGKIDRKVLMEEYYD